MSFFCLARVVLEGAGKSYQNRQLYARNEMKYRATQFSLGVGDFTHSDDYAGAYARVLH
jgi:hypothetical protein